MRNIRKSMHFFFLFLVLGSCFTQFAFSAFAETRVDELKQNISSHQDEIKKLEEEIAAYKQKLNDVGDQKKTLQSAVQALDLSRAKLTTDAKLTQVKIVRASETITDLNINIAQKQEHIEKNKKLIGNIIHKIDQSDADSLVEVLLANPSISAFLLDVDDMARLQSSIRDSITSLMRLKNDLSEKKTTYEAEQKKLIGLKNQLADQKLLADQRRLEQNRLLSDTKNQEANYKKLLATKIANKKQFEKEIDNFEAQLRAEIDPNSFPRAGTKVLAYPIDDVFITQKFGKTSDSGRLYSSGTHNGMDFRATVGTPIKAAGDGIVVGTGDTDRACRGASYGRWVLIQHRNGLSSIYAHLELIKVNQGDQVKVGDIIGYSGSTGYATGPHLHFSLFVTSVVQILDLPSKTCPKAVFHIPVSPPNGYLDPQAYL